MKPGMTLLSALQKINVVPESVIATRNGEMILDDEILKDGDEVKLIAVISGGSCLCEERSLRRSNLSVESKIASLPSVARNDVLCEKWGERGSNPHVVTNDRF